MSTDTMIGVDLAKSVFQVHGASMSGEIRFQHKLSRQAFGTFMANPTLKLAGKYCLSEDRVGEHLGNQESFSERAGFYLCIS